MQFRLLGPLEVRTNDGQPARVGAEKHRILAAVLLLSANRPVPVRSLVRAIWPGDPPRSAAAVLRTYASALRKALFLDRAGSTTRLDARNGCYQLHVAPTDLDLLVFQDLSGQGLKALAEGDLPRTVATLQRALALWRGQPLEDVPLEGEYAVELTRLAELKLNVIESVAEAWLALGREDEVLAWLTPLVAAQPIRERLHAHWMRALYRSGRQSEALSAFQKLRTRLVEQLGVEPSPPLQRLYRQILAGDPELDRRAVASVSTAEATASGPHQLPPSVRSFTGRTAELAVLRRLLVEQRDTGALIVAIDGLGGVGKSTLAVQAGHQLADRFPDGQLYADLGATAAAARPPAPLAVLNRFLRALGGGGGALAALDEAAAAFRAATANRCILVVLDNARDAAQIQPLLPGGEECRTIVTSRQVMATLDSAFVHLDLLGSAEAVTLLGRLAGTDRIATDRDAAEEIARLCGYLPMALRIAAARLTARPTWPAGALAERLADADGRLDQLRHGDTGLRACFASSLHALRNTGDVYDRAAAAAFPLLTLLDGVDMPVGLAAAVLGWPSAPTTTVLDRLVDEQLLDGRTPGRYRLHELVRLFGRQIAGERCPAAERAAAVTRALRWYAGVAEAVPRLVRPGDRHPAPEDPAMAHRFMDAREALDWLEFERANIVLAVRQCGAADDVPAGTLTALVRVLPEFFLLRGCWPDWIEVSRAALHAARRAGDLSAEAYAERDLGLAHERLADYPRAIVHLDAGLAIFRELGERPGIASCLTGLGVSHTRQGRYADAVTCHQEASLLRRTDRDRSGHAASLNHLGTAYLRQGDFARARECYEEGCTIAAHVGDRWVHAAILTNLGALCERLARYPESIGWHERGLAMLREIDDHDGLATCLNHLGRAHRRMGDFAQAVVNQQQALGIARQLGARLTEAECLRELGAAEHGIGLHAQARASWQQAQEILDTVGAPGAAEIRALVEASSSARSAST